jgi:hypothetical protein
VGFSCRTLTYKDTLTCSSQGGDGNADGSEDGSQGGAGGSEEASEQLVVLDSLPGVGPVRDMVLVDTSATVTARESGALPGSRCGWMDGWMDGWRDGGVTVTVVQCHVGVARVHQGAIYI